jgi:TRAP-type C4-dicarboxylate transport system substrate-binding protein
MKTGLGFLLVALAALAAWPIAGMAETKLKWAHVYEVAEPYHTEALWAAEEIKKRTNGKYQIDVFAASQLGNEDQRGIGAWHRRHDLHRGCLRWLYPQADRHHQCAVCAA